MDARTGNYLMLGVFLAAILIQGNVAASLIVPVADGSEINGWNNDRDASINKSPNQMNSFHHDARLVSSEFNAKNIEQDLGFPIVSIDPLMFGSKVAIADGDNGRMIYDFTCDSVIAYWDIGLNINEFDAGDVVYYHMNQNTKTVGLNDIRLKRYGNHLPGSKVNAVDVDIGKELKSFPEGSGIVFVDLNGDKGYDLMDPVYFHINNSASEIDRLDLRLSFFANEMAGTVVGGRDPDCGITVTPLASKPRFYNFNGNIRSDGTPIYDETDLVYLDVSAGDPHGSVVVNDVRLS